MVSACLEDRDVYLCHPVLRSERKHPKNKANGTELSSVETAHFIFKNFNTRPV